MISVIGECLLPVVQRNAEPADIDSYRSWECGSPAASRQRG